MKLWFVIVIQLILAAACFAAPARADETQKAKARQHFKQGVEYFDERRFGDALTEFEQSYALFPVYSTLFNVGQVQVALGHPVQAVDAYEKFLVGGGSSIPKEQRERVEAELTTQRRRIGDIKVTVEPEGSEVRVDGESIGKAPPNGEVRVAAGHHRLEAMLDGYRSEHSEVDVPGQGHIELTIKLQPLPQLAATTAVAASSAAQPTASPITNPMTPAPKPASAPSTPASSNLPAKQPDGGPSSNGNAQRITGYTLAGLGLVTAGVGVAFGVDGQSKHNDALSQWAAGNHDTAKQTESDSSKEKTRGYVVMGVGGAVLATGVIVLLTAPANHSGHTRLHWSTWVGSSVTGAAVEGSW